MWGDDPQFSSGWPPFYLKGKWDGHLCVSVRSGQGIYKSRRKRGGRMLIIMVVVVQCISLTGQSSRVSFRVRSVSVHQPDWIGTQQLEQMTNSLDGFFLFLSILHNRFFFERTLLNRLVAPKNLWFFFIFYFPVFVWLRFDPFFLFVMRRFPSFPPGLFPVGK